MYEAYKLLTGLLETGHQVNAASFSENTQGWLGGGGGGGERRRKEEKTFDLNLLTQMP